MKSEEYSWSHQDSGRGDQYDAAYQRGYYHQLWKDVEEPLVKQVLRSVSEDSGHDMLVDIACGTGRMSLIGAAYFENIVGIDISADMLSLARRHENEYPNIDFEQRDLQSASAADEFCQAHGKVACATAFRLFTNADEQLRSIAAEFAFEILNDEGVFIANTHMNPKSLTGSIYALERWSRERLGRRQRMFNKLLAPEELKSLLMAQGFSKVEMRPYGAFPGLPKVWRWVPDGSVRRFEQWFGGRHWNQCALVIAHK